MTTISQALKVRSLLWGIIFIPILLLFVVSIHTLMEKQKVGTKLTEGSINCSDQKNANNDECLELRTERHELFDLVMQDGSLVAIAANGSLTLSAKDLLLSHEAENTLDEVEENTKKLHKRLYGTTAGKAVRQQVAWWNHSRQFSAVRDDISSNLSTGDWIAEDEASGKRTGHDNVPLDYGYVNAGKMPKNFNNWMSVTGQDRIIFKRQIDPRKLKTRSFSLQVIGQPDIKALAPHRVRLQGCQFIKKVAQCKAMSQISPDIKVYRLEVSPVGNAIQTLRLPVLPVDSEQNSVDGLPIYIKQADQSNPEPLALTLENFAWKPIQQSVAVSGNRGSNAFNFKITTADNTLLFDSIENKPTSFAERHGLLSLVGYESEDRTSLAGQVARSRLENSQTEVKLTINDALQTATQKHLVEQLKVIDKAGEFDDVRRAAVVFMKPESGEILAASSFPNPPANVNRWDRLSFSKLFPTLDKFSVHAWQGLDNNNTPGSVFKIVTSLAALKAVEEGNTDVRQMIRGLSGREFKKLTGISVEAATYHPDPGNPSVTQIRNASGTPLLAVMPHKDRNGKTVYPALRSTSGPGCAAKPVVSKDLGMRETVSRSVNTWFVSLGMLMDRQRLESGGKDTYLAQMAEELGFGTKIPLAQPGSPLNPNGQLTNHRGRGSVLSGFTGDLTLRTNSDSLYATGDAIQRLSQNSFGQGVATTPLQMARIVSLVATGNLPQPYLLAGWGGESLKGLKPKSFEFDDIDLLRQGMKAVPEVGTARAAFRKHFPDGKCRTYGKTGTAQVAGGSRKNTRYSAWFVGWMESESGKPDVAFACMATHAFKPGLRYGGEVCGPIIAKTLRDMERQRQVKQVAK